MVITSAIINYIHHGAGLTVKYYFSQHFLGDDGVLEDMR